MLVPFLIDDVGQEGERAAAAAGLKNGITQASLVANDAANAAQQASLIESSLAGTPMGGANAKITLNPMHL